MLQVERKELAAVRAAFAGRGLGTDAVYSIGTLVANDRVTIRNGEQLLFDEGRATLRSWWSETTHIMQRLRDDATCADQEHEARLNLQDPGLSVQLNLINERFIRSRLVQAGRPRGSPFPREQA